MTDNQEAETAGTIANQQENVGTITNQPENVGTITNQPENVGTITNQPEKEGTITNQAETEGTIKNQKAGNVTDQVGDIFGENEFEDDQERGLVGITAPQTNHKDLCDMIFQKTLNRLTPKIDTRPDQLTLNYEYDPNGSSPKMEFNQVLKGELDNAVARGDENLENVVTNMRENVVEQGFNYDPKTGTITNGTPDIDLDRTGTITNNPQEKTGTITNDNKSGKERLAVLNSTLQQAQQQKQAAQQMNPSTLQMAQARQQQNKNDPGRER